MSKDQTSAFGAEKSKILLLLAAAQFLVVLDASITNVALPSIGRALEVEQSGLAWVVNSYVLFFGGFLLLGGRMADLIGRRRIFVYGLILFALASLTAGLAQNEAMLLVSRAAQGLGAALLSPAALSIVTSTFAEGKQRNKALGVWGAVAGAGGAVGVLLGGILTEYLSWRWVFLVNVPVILLVLPLVLRIVPESDSGEEHNDFDIPGAVTVTAGLSMLVYALIDAESAGWASGQTLGLIAGSIAILGLFVLIESRAANPLVPFGIFGFEDPQRLLPCRPAAGGLALFDVLLHRALHPAGTRLGRPEGRAQLPAAVGDDHPRRRCRFGDRQPDRLQARARRRHALHDRSGSSGSPRSRPTARS